MGNKILEQLSLELAKAKQERPTLEKDEAAADNILEESSGNAPKPMFFHQSHNSHGDWGKHWASGRINDDSEDSQPLPGSNVTPNL